MRPRYRLAPMAPVGEGSRTFRRRLLVIAAGALVLRVVYVLTVTRYDHDLYDSLYYELQARSIADGAGFFTDPFQWLRGTELVLQAADHPPLTVFLLLPAALLDLSQLVMRFTIVGLGVGTVVLVGLLAREVAGERAGLVAGAIAAVDPNLWMHDGLLMSEAPTAFLATLLLLLAHRVLQRGASWRAAAGLGVVGGLGMLARAELVLLLVAVVVPVLWVASGRRLRPAAGAVAVAAVGALLVAGPWVAFNLARFEQPTFMSTSDGLALRSANCDESFYGSRIGWPYVFPPCTYQDVDGEQSVVAARNRDDAIEYLGEHWDRVPVVALARLGRVWSVFHPRQTWTLGAKEGRPAWVSALGAAASFALVPFAIVGVRALRRRGVPAWPMVTTILLVNAVILLLVAVPRYRAPAQPALVALAAIGLVAMLDRRAQAAEVGG